MTLYAALLRGINVGGSKKLPMAELREALAELGHTDVRTHLQSGNAVFRSESDDPEALTARLQQALADRFGFDVDCLVRDHAYLRKIVDACPFPAGSLEGRQLHVTYFSADPAPGRFAGIDAARYLPEEFRLGDRALYLYAPDGLGRSKLAPVLSRPAVVKGLVATSRNWNTVTTLAELTRD